MDRKRFLQFCSDYQEAIEENLGIASRSADVDAIHDLRVAIKRLRALMRVFDAIVAGDSGRNSVRALRHLFRAAGAIRDIQVQQRIASRYAVQAGLPQLERYAFVLRLRQGDAFYRFMIAAEEFDARALRRMAKLIERSLDDARTLAASFALDRHVERLLQRITAEWRPRNLHPLRMITKEADNSLYVIEQVLPSPLVDPHVHEILGKMQALLGLWQDHNLAIEFSRAYEPRDEQEHLEHRRFRREVRRERRRLKDEIFTLWCELRSLRGMSVAEPDDLLVVT